MDNRQLSLPNVNLIGEPGFHIAFWPCLSSTDPETAMGIFTFLACFMEYLVGEKLAHITQRKIRNEIFRLYITDVTIYRNFVKMEGEPSQYHWSIDQSQFKVGEWEHDNPDENVMVWGELQSSRGKWKLQIQVKNELAKDDANTLALSYEEVYLRDLVIHIPQAAQDIVIFLGIDVTEDLPSFANCTANEASMRELLAHFFYFERNLQLTTWGVIWEDEQSVDDFFTLLELGEKVGGEFGAWGVSLMVVRALRPHYREVGVDISPYVYQVLPVFPASTAPAFLLGDATLKLASAIDDSNLARDAFDLVEAEVEKNPHHLAGWEILMDLYSSAGLFRECIDTLDRALDVDCTSESMYLNYALVLTEAYEREVKNLPLILTDADDNREAPIIGEVFAAYEAILDDNPDYLEALFLQLKQLAIYNVKEARFWPKFERLVDLDETGSWVGELIDSLYDFDVFPAFPILERAIEKHPARVDLSFNLGSLYMVDEDRDAALKCFQQARELTTDSLLLEEINRALIIAQNSPEFELSLGELEDALKVTIELGEKPFISISDHNATEDQVDFLEDALAEVQTFYGGYVLLAAAYLTWEDSESTLEVLLDGQRCLPNNPNIAGFLSALLWDMGERMLAMNYLDQGLEKNPESVNLLALKSLYLLILGKDEEAEELLKKARRIEPHEPLFVRVHDYIIWKQAEDEQASD